MKTNADELDGLDWAKLKYATIVLRDPALWCQITQEGRAALKGALMEFASAMSEAHYQGLKRNACAERECKYNHIESVYQEMINESKRA